MHTMKNSGVGLFAFLLGGLIGAIVTLFYAPRSGKKTRQIVTTEAQDMMDKAIKAIREAQDTALSALKDTQSHVEALSQETKDRLAKLQEIAENTLDEQKQSIKKGYSNAKKVVQE